MLSIFRETEKSGVSLTRCLTTLEGACVVITTNARGETPPILAICA
nr:MAG TPA: hypothetical protein [Caudoviricetes sp.]